MRRSNALAYQKHRVFTNNENDLTGAVLEELNRSAPVDTPKADDKPALAPDDKKAKK